ncbi:DUF998 domain-containing protein [Micromonospora sp. I033]
MSRTVRLAATLAPLVFIGVDLADSFTRPGYQPARHWVSHLCLGDRGWLGVAKLAVCAALLAVIAAGLRQAANHRHATADVRQAANDRGTAAGLRQADRHRRPVAWSWRTVAVAGLALLVAATFPIDAGLGYPPGAPATHSWHGTVHDLAGAIVVGAMSASAWLLGRDLRRAGHGTAWQTAGRAATAVVVTAFVTCSVLAGLDFAGTLPGAPSGLFERVALYTGVAWIGLAARQALATSTSPPWPPAPSTPTSTDG